jgi:hypothetical protein
MYRVELKDPYKVTLLHGKHPVPNVPCGVERKVLYENNVFLSSVKKEEPFGVSTFLEGKYHAGA